MYLRMEGPEQNRFHDGTRVTSIETYLMWQAAMLTDRGVARAHNAQDQIEARINHGRWIADCKYCRSGMRTSPMIPIACCAECGCIYTIVVFPIDHRDIEKILLARPDRSTQSWLPGETLLELVVENSKHGVPNPSLAEP